MMMFFDRSKKLFPGMIEGVSIFAPGRNWLQLTHHRRDRLRVLDPSGPLARVQKNRDNQHVGSGAAAFDDEWPLSFVNELAGGEVWRDHRDKDNGAADFVTYFVAPFPPGVNIAINPKCYVRFKLSRSEVNHEAIDQGFILVRIGYERVKHPMVPLRPFRTVTGHAPPGKQGPRFPYQSPVPPEPLRPGRPGHEHLDRVRPSAMTTPRPNRGGAVRAKHSVLTCAHLPRSFDDPRNQSGRCPAARTQRRAA